ncbi:EF-hand calcium-binding domain-containing protein 1-like [Liolophura sinensis]|uniref:EF-hand calcium-binding domain-containing protein 1-like n=1 Tax=Liolophura sinensis TaxID=3198878 RepID=UPI003158CB97
MYLMKTKTLLVVFLVTMLVMEEANAWFLRRLVRKICRKVCKRGCKWVYRGRGRKYVCKFACKKVCGKKKRQALEELGHITALPANFDFYDLNDDNFIEIEEFASTLGQEVDEPDLVHGFNDTDINNDGKLSYEEFMGDSSVFFVADPFARIEEDVEVPSQ